jgi:ACR3 family arsenite efflux pump ArsB
MTLFERWLTLWVTLCILAGLILGNVMPGMFGLLAGLEYASVNLVVAVLIWAMVYPMMIAIDFGSIKAVGQKPRGLVITLVINWLIKPFHHGSACGRVLQPCLRRADRPGQGPRIHRGPDPLGGCTLHGDGLCLVTADQG